MIAPTCRRSAPIDLQAGRCFYCHRDIERRGGDIDHFIPWFRYPVDLGHNFVLAHASCNSAKGATLASEEHLAHWAVRNRAHGGTIAAECDRVRCLHDLGASTQVARWAYEQASAAGGRTWVLGKRLAGLTDAWRIALQHPEVSATRVGAQGDMLIERKKQ